MAYRRRGGYGRRRRVFRGRRRVLVRRIGYCM